LTKEWTAGRLHSFIVSALRGAFRKYPAKYETLEAAFVGKKLNEKTNRMSKHYVCNSCRGEFPTSDVNVDHINPVVNPERGFEGFDIFISRMFCGKENLQVLCSECHDKKTREENQVRRSNETNKKRNKE
jgi:5-methylcytosine-specific restriction endonuclease McrA